MIFLIFGSVFTLLLYAFLLFLALWGWLKGRAANIPLDGSIGSSVDGITVVIPFHNEAMNLPLLLAQLAKADPVYFDVEYIFVNDHSTDDWVSTTENWASTLGVKWIDSQNRGKKHAIFQGVTQAKFDVILTTDADCIPHVEWIKTMAHTYQQNGCKMLFGPVTLVGNNSQLSYFQTVDYAAMAAIGGGTANAGFPFLCSGANLMFSKESYLAVFNMIRLEYASGDDVFLLHAFKKRGFSIAFCQSTSAMVQSATESSLSNLVNQRVRWGSKAKGYHDLFSIFVSLTLFILCFFMAYALVCTLVDSRFWIVTMGLFLSKMGMDLLFLSIIFPFFNIKAQWFRLLLIQIAYPFWILFIAFQGFVSNSAWKTKIC